MKNLAHGHICVGTWLVRKFPELFFADAPVESRTAAASPLACPRGNFRNVPQTECSPGPMEVPDRVADLSGLWLVPLLFESPPARLRMPAPEAARSCHAAAMGAEANGATPLDIGALRYTSQHRRQVGLRAVQQTASPHKPP